jgi:hypothetical protein
MRDISFLRSCAKNVQRKQTKMPIPSTGNRSSAMTNSSNIATKNQPQIAPDTTRSAYRSLITLEETKSKIHRITDLELLITQAYTRIIQTIELLEAWTSQTCIKEFWTYVEVKRKFISKLATSGLDQASSAKFIRLYVSRSFHFRYSNRFELSCLVFFRRNPIKETYSLR